MPFQMQKKMLVLILFLSLVPLKAGWAQDTIEAGLRYLLSVQRAEGYWDYVANQPENRVGLTGLAVLAFLNAGDDPQAPFLQKAYGYIAGHQKANGAIIDSDNPAGVEPRQVFSTACALWALAALRNLTLDTPFYQDPQKNYDAVIQKAFDYLLAAQIAGDITIGGTTYVAGTNLGGWGYDTPPVMAYSDRLLYADTANTYFALMALRAVEDTSRMRPLDRVWSQASKDLAIDYLQNRQLADGGFEYRPRPDQAGVSFGSTTAGAMAGLWNCGTTRMDATITGTGGSPGALEWLDKNFSLAENINQADGGKRFYYTYLLQTVIAIGDYFGIQALGDYPDAYGAVARYLISTQLADGSWPVVEAREPAAMTTALAILTLQDQEPWFESETVWSLRGDAGLKVYDIFGDDIETLGVVPEITGSGSSRITRLTLPEPLPGKYRIEVIADDAASYELSMQSNLYLQQKVSIQTLTDVIPAGKVHEYDAVIATVVGPLNVDIRNRRMKDRIIEPTDTLVIYFDATDALTPKFRRFDELGFTEPNSMQPAQDRVSGYYELATSFDNRYNILALMAEDRRIYTYEFSYGLETVQPQIHPTNPKKSFEFRSFDVAFEQNSGIGLLVYKHPKNKKISVYERWDPQTGWSAPLDGPAFEGNEVRFIELYPQPNSNTIIGLFQDSDEIIKMSVWNGEAGNWSPFEYIARAEDSRRKNFNAACENLSGELLITVGMSGKTIGYRSWNDVTGLSALSKKIIAPMEMNDNLHIVSLAVKPGSDEILLVCSNESDTTGVGAMVWDGNQWLQETELTHDIGGSAKDKRVFDVAYEQGSGRGLIVYSDFENNNLYRTVTNGKIGAPIRGPLAVPLKWIKLTPDISGAKNGILLVAQGLEDNTLYGARWTGFWWDNVTVLAPDNGSQEAFAVIYKDRLVIPQ